jgi:hypothetical protein
LAIHSSIDGHLGYFQLLAIGHIASMSINIEIAVALLSVFLDLCIPKSRIGGSYDSFTFKFLRNHHTFHSGCTILYSLKQWGKFPLSSHLCELSLSSVLSFAFSSAILMSVKWQLIVILICVSLMSKDTLNVFS